jgi:hypothetical protein
MSIRFSDVDSRYILRLPRLSLLQQRDIEQSRFWIMADRGANAPCLVVCEAVENLFHCLLGVLEKVCRRGRVW